VLREDSLPMVSIPNGLPRPFSPYFVIFITPRLPDFNPERAPQAI